MHVPAPDRAAAWDDKNMNLVDAARICFADDYRDARQRFLDACARARLETRQWLNPHPGPLGETLATDSAWIGPRDARAVLVMVSATHGVEGFPGSAAQIDWVLHACPDPLPDEVAVLVVHAINPFGFAWLRRVTEEGVDLNRNFVDFSRPLPDNPGYDTLADALLPERLDAESLRAADARIEAYRSSHGEIALMLARSGGQYSHPNGMFYGGSSLTWSRKTLQSLVDEYRLAECEVVAVVDYHTGLGPFGYGEPICDHTLDTPNAERAKTWYGRSVTQPQLGNSASVPKTGLSEIGWERMLGDRVSFVALEYGTFAPANGLRVLRADHWLHSHGNVDWGHPDTVRIKTDIRDHFAPRTIDWQEMVLFRSRQILRQAVAGLSGAAEPVWPS